jgi:outer membrane protein OmpA-like peptidoglycan-associated protein
MIMKKNFFSKSLMAFALVFVSVGAFAQGYANRDENGNIVRGPYETNKFTDNVFVSAGIGTNYYMGEDDFYRTFKGRFGLGLDLYIGKWFTPTLGLRFGYSGVNANGYTISADANYVTGQVADGIYKEHFGLMYWHGDVMWSMTNEIWGYKEDRIWNLAPYVSAGWARSYNCDLNRHDNEWVMGAGLYNTFRLNDRFDATLDLRGLMSPSRLDGESRDHLIDYMASATVGIAVKLGKSTFKRAITELPNYAPYEEKIAALEGQNAEQVKANEGLEAQNAQLRNQLTNSQAQLAKTQQELADKTTAVAVFFAIDRATLDKRQLTVLKYYVKTILEANPNKTFTIIGSADSATGTPEYNEKLSEKRVDYVYNLLVKKYGISEDRLIKRVDGSANNQFEEPALNRSVVIK